MYINKIIKKVFFNRSLLTLAILLTLIASFTILSPVFLSRASIRNLLCASPQVGLITIGMGLLLIVGEIDLSVGSIFVCSTATMATLHTEYGINTLLAAIITISLGAFLGILNGVITIRARLSSFIVTLGTMWAYRGIMLILIGGYSIPFYPRGSDLIILNTVAGEIWGIPSQFLWLIAVTIFLWILLEHTKFGNWTYATGSDKESAYMTGINVDRVKIACFGILGMLCALAGLIQVSRVNASVPQTGEMIMLMAVAGAVVGGVSLRGGRGTILNCLIGSFIIQVISLGLVTLGIVEYYTNVAICILLIITAYIHSKLTLRGQ